ncbi:ExbD/TolR family protein [Bacteroidota bacterium]
MARRGVQEINAGSMADIAFLLLIFFLVATTMDIDTGLSRLLPPMPEEDQQDDDDKIRERNVFVILINKQDQLFVEKEIIDVSELKEKTIEFFLNPNDHPDLPEKRPLTVDFFGDMMVSKGVISLRNDNGTSYGKYIAVQNELAAAVNELRNNICMERFGKKYDALDPLNETEKDLIAAVKKVYPMAISEAEPVEIK